MGRAEKLETAIAEAKRFIERAEAEQERRAKDAAWLYNFQGCRESGACNRASMDLTRALADLRRAG